uniref:Zinc finger protein GLIS1 n=1 Tax=Schistosoma mansoni TaxID=6183 RepID=A0A5K4FA67_SCHMA
MNWSTTSKYTNEHIQSNLFTEQNTHYFPSYTLSNMKVFEKIVCPFQNGVVQNESKKYLHSQNQDNITSTSQEYEMLDPLYSVENYQDHYIEKYPHYHSLTSTSLQESINSQSINKERVSFADKLYESCYLRIHNDNNNSNNLDNKNNNYTRLQDEYTGLNAIPTCLKCYHSTSNYQQYSVQKYLFDQTSTDMNKHKQIPDHFNTVKRDNIEDVKQTSMELNEERLSVVGAKTLTCQWKSCRLTFTDHKSFVNHIESSHVSSHISNKEYCCYWEGCRRQLKPFNARYKLIVHLRIHSGDRPNKCTYPGCFKAFSRLENLKIHIRSHTGERPFICQQEGCDRTFSNSSDRAKHQRTHIHTKPYACKITGCTKRYTDPSSLRKHSKLHSIFELSQPSKSDVIKKCKLSKDVRLKCSNQLNIRTQNQKTIIFQEDMNYSQNYYPENNTDSYGIYGSFNDTIPSYCIQNNLKLSNRNCTNIQSSNMTKITNDFPCSYISSYQSTVNGNSPSQWNPSLDQFNSYEIDHTSRLKYHWNEDSSYTHHNHQHIK